MIRRPPRSTLSSSSAASDVYKRQPVAAQARMQSDLDLATKVHDHVQDWLDRNRPYRGVAWSSGIEVALRLVALVAISELLEPQAQVVGVYAAVLEHADYLRRFPSRYS